MPQHLRPLPPHIPPAPPTLLPSANRTSTGPTASAAKTQLREGQWAGGQVPSQLVLGRAMLSRGVPYAHPGQAHHRWSLSQDSHTRVCWSEQSHSRRLEYLGEKLKQSPLFTQAVCSPLPISSWLFDCSSRPSCLQAATCLITAGLTQTCMPALLFPFCLML